MFSHFTIGKKLLLKSVVAGVFVALLIGLVFTGFRLTEKQFNRITEDSVPDIIAILELKSLSKRLFAEIQGYAATGEEEEIEEFSETLEIFDEWVTKYQVSIGDTVEQELKDELIEHKKIFMKYAETVFKNKQEVYKLLEDFDGHVVRIHDLFVALPVELADEVHSDLVGLQIAVYDQLLTPEGDDDEGEEVKDEGDEALEKIEHTIESLLSLSLKMNSETASLQLSEMIGKLEHVVEELLEKSKLVFETLEDVESYEEEILKTLDKLVYLQSQEVQEAFRQTRATIDTFTLLVVGVGLLSLIASYLISRRIAFSITSFLNSLNKTIGDVARGDFSKRAVIQNRDEIGELAEKFNVMTESLEQITVSRNFVDSVLGRMSESLLVLGADGRIQKINPAAGKLLGYSKDELVGKSFNIVLGDADTGGDESLNWDKLFSLLLEKKEYSKETFYHAQHGKKIPVLLSASVIYNEDQKIQNVVCVAADISELKKAQENLQESYEQLKNTQEQLVQSSKLASIGELASGVAHELNQPLMIIRTSNQLVERKHQKGTLKDEKLLEHLESVRNNSKRMMNIIDHLRTFSRQSTKGFVAIDVVRVIKNSYYLLGEQFKLKNIEITDDFADGLPSVMADENQIEQVILNLLANGRDAIVEKNESLGVQGAAGVIHITTGLSENDPQFVEITIKDSGSGIPEESRDKIFDPFYTSKEVGQGTGLGLSISYGIIQDHGGEISVVETGKNGTTFMIRLPLIQDES